MAEPRELPAKGWVEPGQVIHCDVDGRRVYVWELHHIIPISWGGSDSRLLTDHQVVWIRVCGDCHSVIHMILDRAHKDGGWPQLWINSHGGIPHLVVEAARRGWNGYKCQTFGEST
jgi:hypothetical protein